MIILKVISALLNFGIYIHFVKQLERCAGYVSPRILSFWKDFQDLFDPQTSSKLTRVIYSLPAFCVSQVRLCEILSFIAVENLNIDSLYCIHLRCNRIQ